MDITKLEALFSKIATLSPELAAEIEALASPEPTAPVTKPSIETLKADPWVGPMPPKSSITYLQTTVWDNGPEPKITKNGHTGKRTRYGVTIEAYTKSADRLVTLGLNNSYEFKRNVQLRPLNKFLPLLKKNNASGRITDEFKAFLDQYTRDPSVSDDYFGFVLDSGKWNYHSGQFVHMRLTRDNEPEVFLIQDDEFIALDTWDVTDRPKAQIDRKWTNKLDLCGYEEAKARSTKTRK